MKDGQPSIGFGVPVEEADAGDPRQQLRQARTKLRLAEAKVQLAHTERSLKMMEALSIGSDYWVSIYSDRLDRLHVDPDSYYISNARDRRYGRNIPVFQTEQELNILRMQARIVCGTNSYAQGLIEGLTSYVIGNGYTYRATSKDDAQAELVAAVQDVIDDFLERNDWYGGEQPGFEEELFIRSIEDGEFFVRDFSDPDDETRTVIRTVEPEQVTQPSGTHEKDWSFGINTPPEDSQRPLAYWVAYNEDTTEGEEVEPDDIVHFRRNVKRSIKRGLPDFCFDTRDAVEVSSKLCRNMGLGAALQAALAGIRQHENSSKAQVQSMQDLMADYTRTNPVTDKTDYIRRYQPGSWADIPKGMTYVDPPAYKSAQSFVDILHACLRRAGIKWNAPEWLATASGADMAAYTASLTAESPFVRTVTRRQRGYREVFKLIVWRSVRNYVQAHGGTLSVKTHDGAVRTYSWREIEALIKLQVEAPKVESQNKLTDAQVHEIELRSGVLSVQTWQQQSGYDQEQEAVNREEWRERFGDQGQPLPVPGPEGAGLSPSPFKEAREGSGGKLLNVPDVRQTTDYTCGPAAVASVLRYFGIEATEEELAKSMGASPERGVPPSGIIAAIRAAGLQQCHQHNCLIETLLRALDGGTPVICPIQAHGRPADYQQLESGHYVIVIGYDDTDNLILQDPSAGRGKLPITDFVGRWRDKAADGAEYVRYGIAVWKE